MSSASPITAETGEGGAEEGELEGADNYVKLNLLLFCVC